MTTQSTILKDSTPANTITLDNTDGVFSVKKGEGSTSNLLVVDSTGITTGLKDGSVTADKLANGAVTAEKLADGALLENTPNAIGYATGAGGSVTQLTSRNTAVTLNTPTGAITMFTATGSGSWSNFTFNNSLITAGDVIALSIRSGASNAYLMFAYSVTNGSCSIAFASMSGAASDTPVINFAIIKGVNA